QEFGPAVGQPLLGRGGLALWAMPVAAGIVGDAPVGALLAAFGMPAQRRRSAALDRRHDLELAEADMAGMDPRREAVATVRSGGGPLTDLTPAAHPLGREQLKMLTEIEAKNFLHLSHPA